MDALQAATSTQGATDVFSLSDQVLSDRLQFVEEIGFGNWGSVWLCRPKSKRPESSKKSLVQDQIAVKLVHRSDKTPTTAARVKSLWNEMKIIRSFKTDTHPAIIPFHSFIITPSYALITMTYHPTLIPVEVDELKARDWFRFLLSGVEFLHRRGVVHNDIKPANILVSENNIPVLVDFGFAEKYESGSPKAFQSNLSYGTPEYLAPERARGLPHDTRKSDVWSLGVSFFEILMGRTPFEYSDTDQCSTKEELERYWKRTLSGNWLGTWKMTPGMERLLRRMIAPNSELRCTAVQAMNDPYWQYRKEMRGTHRTSSSYGSSIVFEKDLAKLMLIDQPPMPTRLPTTAEVPSTPPGLSPAKRLSSDKKDSPLLAKPKSQTKIAPPVTPRIQPRKRIATGATTPIRPKTSPATPSSSVAGNSGKENIRSFLVNPSNVSTPTRKPHVPGGRENLVPRSAPRPATAGADVKERRRSRVLGEVSVNVNRTRDYKSKDSLRKDGRTSPAALVKKEVKKEPSLTSDKTKTSGSDSVRNRVKEWEKERQRLREMARLELEETSEEEEEEEEEDKESEKEEDVKKEEAVKVEETIEEEKEELAVVEEEEPRRVSGMSTPALSRSNTSAKTSDSPKTPPLSTQTPAIVIRGSKPIARPSTEDHEVDVYKSSPAQMTNRATPAVWLAASPKADRRRSGQGRDSWASDILGDKSSSPLSTILKAKSNERSVAAAKKDRMEAWMRSIEPVKEDHQSSFTSSSAHDILPSLPVPPPRSASRYPSSRSSRNPRRILSASQIFNSDGGPGGTDTPDTSVAGVDTSLVSTPSKGSMLPAVPEVSTPVRTRRATVSTSSPCKLSGGPSEQETPADSPSPSKRREKSKSYGNLLQLRIAPIAELEAEINKPVVPNSSRRLSDVVDSSLFIAPPRSPPPVDFDDDDDQDFSTMEYPSFNDLTSSPIIVESQSKRQTRPVLPDTPSQKRFEGVYDRFRLATSGVRRLGKGYQNDMSTPAMPPSSTPQAVSASGRKIPSRRPAAPPPVALKNFKFDASTHRRTVSAAELGMMSCPAAGAAGETRAKDDSKITVGLMKRAFKAMVPGKTSSKRLSRAA